MRLDTSGLWYPCPSCRDHLGYLSEPMPRLLRIQPNVHSAICIDFHGGLRDLRSPRVASDLVTSRRSVDTVVSLPYGTLLQLRRIVAYDSEIWLLLHLDVADVYVPLLPSFRTDAAPTHFVSRTGRESWDFVHCVSAHVRLRSP